MILGITTLLIALLISTVSAWYSILGLTAIFAGATVPAIIMGGALEAGKVMVAIWLHHNWKRDRLLKFYLVPALVFLMMLTSVGVFGFLSKAHLDQNIPTGDIQAQVQLFDERIQTQRDNIAAARRALSQMDAAVDQTMSRSSDEKGADKAAEMRRAQGRERNNLQNDIARAQKEINKLQEERAPVASQYRKVEAEVGPIKYVAAMFSSGTPDQNMLESAVRWVIILIVIVFDPLAIVLIIAGITQLGWARQLSSRSGESASGQTIDELINNITPENVHPEVEIPKPAEPPPAEPDVEKGNELIAEFVAEREPEITEPVVDTAIDEELAQAKKDREMLAEYVAERETELQAQIDQLQKERDMLFQAHSVEMVRADELAMAISADPIPGVTERPFTDEEVAALDKIISDFDNSLPHYTNTDNPVDFPQDDSPNFEGVRSGNGEWIQTGPAFEEHPETIERFKADRPADPPETLPTRKTEPEQPVRDPRATFGNSFPNDPERGDMFLRTDFKPSRLFKWNDLKWIEVNKKSTDVFNYNDAYIQFLVEKITTGEYSVDDLSEIELQQVQTAIGGLRA
jgi:hypothetical protein